MRRLGAMATLLLLLAAGCGDSGDATTSTAGAPVTTTTSPPTTTVPVTTVPATTAAPATTQAPTTTTAWEDVLDVSGVAVDDPEGLNVRSGPGVDNDIVGSLAYDFSGVVPTGAVEAVGDDTWVEVRADGLEGWVNAAFLAPVSPESAPFSDWPCAVEDIEGTIASSPIPDGEVGDHVLRWRHHTSVDCLRTIIVLGADFAFGDPPGEPAEDVPPDVSVTVDESVVRVELGPIGDADFDATEADRNGDGRFDGFVVRAGTSTGPLYAALHHDDLVEVGAFFLGDPARIVVDTRRKGSAAGLLPATDTFAAIVTDLDVPGQCLATPFGVFGYARPFEAVAEVAIREVPPSGGEPGSGDRVEASYSGGLLEPTTDTGYVVPTTDWISAWGEYSFTVDDVAPGRYEMFVGDADQETAELIGAHQVFCAE